MVNDIEQFSKTLKEKDESGIEYFFQLFATSEENMIPLNVKREKGADKFLEICQKAKAAKYKQVVYKEFRTDRSVKEMATYTFKLDKRFIASGEIFPVKGKKSQFGSGLSGFEGVGGLQGFLGMQNELNKQNYEILFQETRYNQLLDKHKDLQHDYTTIKQDFAGTLERNELLRDDNKKLKNNSQLGAIGMQGALGFFANRFKVDTSTLAGLFGLDLKDLPEQKPPQRTQPNQAIDLNDIKVKKVEKTQREDITDQLKVWIEKMPDSLFEKYYKSVLYYHDNVENFNKVMAAIEQLKVESKEPETSVM